MAPVLFVIAVAVTVVDQGAKALVTRRLRLGCPLNVAARCGLRRAENPAGAFIGASPAQAATLWLAGVGAAIALTALGPALPGAGAVAVGLVIGGATGNLVDRVFRGAVVDFVAIGRWPSFNVADAALVVGAVIAPLSVI